MPCRREQRGVQIFRKEGKNNQLKGSFQVKQSYDYIPLHEKQLRKKVYKKTFM